MPPHRKPPEPGRTSRVYLRLPSDVLERIEAKAKRERAARSTAGELVKDMEAVLARYGSRITVTELNEALLHAVDEALAARTDDQLQQQLDRLRVIRRTMLESERRATPHEGE